MSAKPKPFYDALPDELRAKITPLRKFEGIHCLRCMDTGRLTRDDHPPLRCDCAAGAGHVDGICDTCSNHGFFIAETGETVDCKDCEAGLDRRQRKLKKLFAVCGMPDGSLARTTFEMFEDLGPMAKGKSLAIAAAIRFTEGGYFTRTDLYKRLQLNTDGVENIGRRGVVLYGVNGTGKTALSIAATSHLAGQGHVALWLNVLDYLTRVQQSYGSGETESLMREAMTAPYLFLDEFNIDNPSNDRVEKMRMIIHSRNAAGLPYFITTNLNPATFEGMWGNMVSSRVNDDCHWVPMGGEPFRIGTANHEYELEI